MNMNRLDFTVIAAGESRLLHKAEPISDPSLCSGFGSFHSDTGKNPKPLAAITLPHIRHLIDHPQQVDKSQAQWLIPSTLISRTFKEQEQRGSFWMLWADLDKNPPQLDHLQTMLRDWLMGADFEVYSSRSATADCPKWHVLIPLAGPLSGADWCMAQEVLNDHLQDAGIEPDRASERAAQLCYLPNRGEFYETRSRRNGRAFDALDAMAFGSDIASKRAQHAAEAEALHRQREAAKTRRESRTDAGDNPDTIGAFNLAFTVCDILLQAGYEQRGNGFRHPRSESGSYSASVKNDRVHALSPNDPLYSDGRGAHDAFSAFEVLFHQGNRNSALKDAGDNWLAIRGESWNKAKQREFMQTNAGATVDEPLQCADDGEPGQRQPFSLLQFSLKGRSKEMREKMLADKYVLGKIAILGQITAIYAKPNSGKTLLTLHLIIEGLKSGELDGDKVFYLNADDTYKGLVYKNELAERYGFHMIAPGMQNFDSAMFLRYLQQMIKDGTAHGAVVVLDTLKKFTDIMDKRVASDFGKVIRAFAQAGGTAILLAHTNKNRDSDGKVVFSGTSDIVDDADCAYTLDVKEAEGDLCTVLFENIKQRGDVVREAAYSYSRRDGILYSDLLDSIEQLTEEKKRQHQEQRQIEHRLARNHMAIAAITEAIESGAHLKTELIELASKNSGISRPKIAKALDDHTGKEWKLGHRWRMELQDKNARHYHLLTVFHREPKPQTYAEAKCKY